jgi:hypothetical protein
MAQSPDQIAAKWAQNLSANTDRIKEGVQSITVAPGMAAAAAKETWATNTLASKDKWASRTGAVTKEEWQNAMIEKGLNRIAGGAQAAVPRFNAFMGRLLPHIDSVKRGLPARGTLEQNIARSAAFIRGMSKFQNR